MARFSATDIEPGTRFYIRWDRSEDWQARVAIWKCSAKEYRRLVGEDPPDQTEDFIWHCLTPDGDVYPHILLKVGVAGMSVCRPDGSVIPGQAPPTRPNDPSSIYGGEWTPEPSEFYAALKASAEGVPKTACTHISQILEQGFQKNP